MGAKLSISLSKWLWIATGAPVAPVFLIALAFPNGYAGDAARRTIPIQVIVVESSGEAEKILERLKKGDDFTVIARQKSIDATSIDGGFAGEVDLKTLRPELREALEGLRAGQISRITKIPAGFAILKALPRGEAENFGNADSGRLAAMRAEGSVRYAPNVDGLSEALAALVQIPKPEGWSQDLQSICESHRQSYATVTMWAQRLLDPANEQGILRDEKAKPLDKIQAYVARGQLYAYQGQMGKAIEQFETAERIGLSDLPSAVPYMDEVLGISYLHQSEMENSVYRHPGEKCLFPMRPQDRYTQTAASQKAVQYFLKYLKNKPDELEVKWLLTLACMTLGKCPADVPSQHLLPLSTFASTENIGRFTDVAGEAGLNLFAMAAGVIVDDFDNDGAFDVVASSWDACEPMHYFHNNGNGTFVDRADKAGLSGQLGGLNLIQTDYNNDGCLDILVLRGAWEPIGQRRSLLRNNCDGTFTDVTRASGLAIPATNTQAGVWADINNDGWLDLFVGNESGPSHLYLNQGNGTFTDISGSAGIDRSAFTKGVVAADYDNDGYVDFYVTNLNTENFLYHNNGNGTFAEVGRNAGVPGTGKTFASWFFDYNNDGLPDLFVTSYFVSVDETVRTYLNLPHNAGTLKLYKNVGNGAFLDVTKETKLDRVFMPMGANFGDVDNDGYLDIYLGTGNPSYGSLVPNVLLHNKQGKTFVDITASSGTGELHKGHGIGFADLDNDGDEDIVTPIGGAVPGDRHAMRLFENPGNGNDWISLKLVGVKANRAAIGARIKVTVQNEGQGTRAVYRTVGSGGSFGSSPLEQHIGLGKSAAIVSVEIRWPGGGETPQTFSHVAKNQTIEIKESSREYTTLSRRFVRLGGPQRMNAALPRAH